MCVIRTKKDIVKMLNEHKKLWNWISLNVVQYKPRDGVTMKELYFKVYLKAVNPCVPDNHCYMCEIAEQLNLNCETCVAKWGAPHCLDSLYGLYLTECRCGHYVSASITAHKIANIEVNIPFINA